MYTFPCSEDEIYCKCLALNEFTFLVYASHRHISAIMRNTYQSEEKNRSDHKLCQYAQRCETIELPNCSTCCAPSR